MDDGAGAFFLPGAGGAAATGTFDPATALLVSVGFGGGRLQASLSLKVGRLGQYSVEEYRNANAAGVKNWTTGGHEEDWKNGSPSVDGGSRSRHEALALSVPFARCVWLWWLEKRGRGRPPTGGLAEWGRSGVT